jgi:hypothetical protein
LGEGGDVRFFAVAEGYEDAPEPFRIIAEYIGGYDRETDDCTFVGGDAVSWKDENCRTEEQLQSTAKGRLALERWRAGDDSVHVVTEREVAGRFLLEDRQDAAGREARPDLFRRFQEAMDAGDVSETRRLMEEIRAVGAKLVPELVDL